MTYWHRGRCLAYGEGVAYWALAEMVRMRARIAEDEEPASALEKLARRRPEHVTDDEERRFVEPRLAHLLGLEESDAVEREDLFAAWRLFFERLADVYPVAMVFEDMQWADTALLDFVEYLLEWSRNSPLFVMTLARPELLDGGRPGAPASRESDLDLPRAASRGAMEDLLDGLVPGSRRRCGGRSSNAPKGSRCTPWRPCECCSTAAPSSRRGPSTGRRGRSSRSRCPRRCTR